MMSVAVVVVVTLRTTTRREAEGSGGAAGIDLGQSRCRPRPPHHHTTTGCDVSLYRWVHLAADSSRPTRPVCWVVRGHVAEGCVYVGVCLFESVC